MVYNGVSEHGYVKICDILVFFFFWGGEVMYGSVCRYSEGSEMGNAWDVCRMRFTMCPLAFLK